MKRQRRPAKEITRSEAIKNNRIVMKEEDKICIIEQERIWDRPASSRPKMPRSQRAKQFAPFDALTGLSERLRQAEEEHEREQERTVNGKRST